MSEYGLVKIAEPATPAANESTDFFDTADLKRKVKDYLGIVGTLSEDGLRGTNVIINGEFDFAQRQAPGTLTTYSNTSGRALSADRWGITNENASAQYQRVDSAAAPETGLRARFYGSFSKITASGKIVVSHVIEAVNGLHLRGRTVRVQLKMKASSAKTIRVALLQLTAAGAVDTIPAVFVSLFGANTVDPTFGTNLAAIAPVIADNGSIRNTGLDCAVTAAWQRFGASFVLPNNFKNLILVVFTDSQFAAADILSMTEVGIYDGPEIREWVPRSQGDDLTLCQRYYSKSFNVDTAPVQNAGVNTGEAGGIAGKAGAVANAGFIFVTYKVQMRTAAALTLFNPAVANAQVRDEVAAVDHSATATANSQEQGFTVNSTGNASTAVGDRLGIHWTADAEL
jgi:hypothetical protein